MVLSLEHNLKLTPVSLYPVNRFSVSRFRVRYDDAFGDKMPRHLLGGALAQSVGLITAISVVLIDPVQLLGQLIVDACSAKAASL